MQAQTPVVPGLPGKNVTSQIAQHPGLPIRLSKAFGSTPETWLRMQLACDLARARNTESKIKVQRQDIPQEMHAQ
jgi:antitoxin HigA-1